MSLDALTCLMEVDMRVRMLHFSTSQVIDGTICLPLHYPVNLIHLSTNPNLMNCYLSILEDV